MHIGDLLRRTWEERGLYASRRARLRTFLTDQEEHPERPLEDILTDIRTSHNDLFGLLVPPLLETDDKLLRITIIRNADLNSPKELRLLKEFVRRADPMQDEPELLAIAALGHAGLTNQLRKGGPLPLEVHQAISTEPLPARRATNVDAGPEPFAAAAGESRSGPRSRRRTG